MCLIEYIPLCVAALVICSGGESLIVRVHAAYTTCIKVRKGETHTTCALCALCSVLYCSSQHFAVFLSTWLRASLSEHQCWAGERERECRRRADRDAGCFWERVWERGGRRGATGDAAALRADSHSLSALRPLGGDAGDPPLRSVRVAFTRPAAPRDTYVRPFFILFCICISYSHSSYLSIFSATSYWVLYGRIRIILYSIMYSFSLCSWLPMVCVPFCWNWKDVLDAQHRCPRCLRIIGIKSRWGS